MFPLSRILPPRAAGFPRAAAVALLLLPTASQLSAQEQKPKPEAPPPAAPAPAPAAAPVPEKAAPNPLGEPPEENPAPAPPPAMRIQLNVAPGAQGGAQIQVQGQARVEVQIQGQAQAQAAAQPDDGKGTPWLGVQMEATSQLELDEDEKPPPGVGILGVVDESPAAKGGVKIGDRVLKINDTVLKNEQDLRGTVRNLKIGDAVTLTIDRQGKEEKLKLTLEKMPAQIGQQALFGAGFGQLTLEGSKPTEVRFYGAPAVGIAHPAVDSVQLRDSNRIDGQIVSISADSVILKMQTGGEVPLDVQDVESVRFSGPGPSAEPPAALLLRSGGWLAAKDVSLAAGGGRFSAKLDAAAIDAIPRDAVHSLVLTPKQSATAYFGPNMSDGWSAAPEECWKFEGGAWVTQPKVQGNQQILARKFTALPPSYEFSFELSGPEKIALNAVLGGMMLSTDDSYSAPGAVNVQINEAGVNSGGISATQYDGVRFFGGLPTADGAAPKPFPERSGTSRRVAIFWDRPGGILGVQIDGELLAKFDVAKIRLADMNRAGRVLRLVAPQQGLRISNMVLRPWLGQALPAPLARPQEPDILAASGGKSWTRGLLQSLDSHNLTLAKSPPVARSQSAVVALAPPAAQPPGDKDSGAAPQFWVELKDGSSFPVSNLQVQNSQAVLGTQFAGQLHVPQRSLRRIGFAPPKTPRLASVDGSGLDVLTFRDGRQLRGTFAPPMEAAKIRWKLSASKAPLEFSADEASALRFAARPNLSPADGPQVLRLRNGDWLPGEIVAVDAQFLTWKTAFHEGIKINRGLLGSLFPSPASSGMLADTASGRQPWKVRSSGAGQVYVNGRLIVEEEEVTTPDWKYVDGAYQLQRPRGARVSNQMIALPLRPMKSPTSIEFALDGSEGYFMMQIPASDGSIFASMYGSSRYIQVTRNRTMQMRQNGDLQNRGIFIRPEQFSFNLDERPSGPMRMQLVFDPAGKQLHLAANGKKLGTCKFKDDAPWPDLKSIQFSGSYGTSGSLRIADVWVSPWAGRLGDTKPGAPGSVSLFLANGDETPGTLLGLSPTEVEIDCDAGPLPLPLSRIQVIDFNQPPDPAAATTTTAAPYRIRFYDRGILSASAVRIGETALTASTAHGDLSIPLPMVKELVFAKTEAKK